MNKKLLSTLFLPLLILSSCGSGNTPSESSSEKKEHKKTADIVVKEREIQYIDDFYRNYYQIFPISYADSNNDGKGDLQGIIDKFDYIKSLNVTGLWLTPVHESPTYHKYDVKNYKSIDPVFGSLATYDALVKKCHDNHMKIILDLVFNHSSNKHPWFTECMEAHLYNDTGNKYYNYYNVSETSKTGYRNYSGTDLYYEARFDAGMPDLNLQGVIDGTNTNLINDLKDIMSFWLIDHNVDGFRLDACTSFFTGDIAKNIEFLDWMKTTAEEIKEGSFIIGEVLERSSTYSRYYESEADAFFAFDDACAMGNNVFNCVNRESVEDVNKFINSDIKFAKDHIPAPVLANHDIGRSTKVVEEKNKLMHALFSLANGATFEYYGDEIGMKSVGAQPEDFGYRQPLKWGDSYTCTPTGGSCSAGDELKYPFGSVADQNKNESSLLNFYRKVFKTRLQNPELARGTCEIVSINEEKNCGILKRTYNNSVLYMAINLSSAEEYELDVSSLNGEIVADLSALTSPFYSDDKLIMTPYSILLFH